MEGEKSRSNPLPKEAKVSVTNIPKDARRWRTVRRTVLTHTHTQTNACTPSFYCTKETKPFRTKIPTSFEKGSEFLIVLVTFSGSLETFRW